MSKGLVFILLLGGLTLAFGCKSSGTAPPDPVAVDYCAACGERPNCPSVIDDALNSACPDQTRVYYVCVTENNCDPLSCDTEWQARQSCFFGEDAGTDAGPDGATEGAPFVEELRTTEARVR